MDQPATPTAAPIAVSNPVKPGAPSLAPTLPHETSMAARASRSSIARPEPRERRRRESFAPLTLGSVPFAIAGTVAEPAFRDVEEAFFRAGSEPTLKRNEGDEYEQTPGFWQRVFARHKTNG